VRDDDSDSSMHILLRQVVPRLACLCMLSPGTGLPQAASI